MKTTIAALAALILFSLAAVASEAVTLNIGDLSSVTSTPVVDADSVIRPTSRHTFQWERTSGTPSVCTYILEARLKGATVWVTLGSSQDCAAAATGVIEGDGAFDFYRGRITALTGAGTVAGYLRLLKR